MRGPSVRVRSPLNVQLEARVVSAVAKVLLIVRLPRETPVPQVRVLSSSAAAVLSSVTVFPVRSNVPFWVKLRSMVMAVPEYVMVAPELLVRELSLKSQPLPLCVMVPALMRVLVLPATVQVPEEMVIVPLLVRPVLEDALASVVVGLAPRLILQPEAIVMSAPAEVFVTATVPPKDPVQVIVESSLLPVLSNVTVFPVRSNVPFWVKFRSIVIVAPAYVIVAPELLVREVSLKSQSLPECVIVPALVRMPPVGLVTVQVPEAMVTVPLLVKSSTASLSIVVVGEAPNAILHPLALMKSPSEFLVMTTVPPKEPEHVTVVSSELLVSSKVTVFPVKSNVPLWVKERSIVIAVPAYVIVAPLLLVSEASLKSHPGVAPVCVIVPALMSERPRVAGLVTVQVPESITMVPLLVKVEALLLPPAAMLVVGLAPKLTLQPLLMAFVVPPEDELVFVNTTVPPSVLAQVMVELSLLLVPSNVTVMPLKLNVPFWVKFLSMVIAVPA